MVNVLIGGDWKAEIGTNGAIPGPDQTERRSKDGVINKAGQMLLEEIAERDWHIPNGNVQGDEEYSIGNGLTVIDYAMASSEGIEKVDNLLIETWTESDHMPLKV